MRQLILLCFLILNELTAIAQSTQNIRGHIEDVASGQAIIGAVIRIDGGDMNGISDNEGKFIISDIPVGRHTISATYIGYEPIILKEQLLSTGKEMVLQLQMRECMTELGEVVVKPRVNKQMPLNEMALVGARMFSVEEAMQEGIRGYYRNMSRPGATQRIKKIVCVFGGDRESVQYRLYKK